jgi:hypothetical protein
VFKSCLNSLGIQRRAGLASLVVAMAGVLAASPSFAQTSPTISQQTATASPPLTNAQVAQIDAFIDHWIGQLREARDTGGLSAARSQIIGQIQLPGSSAAFREQYVKSLVSKLTPLLQDGRLVDRLNGMIMLSRTDNRAVYAIVEQALADEKSAVRYWAAKTIEDVEASQATDAPAIPTALRQSLLTALQTAAEQETEPATLAQIFSAMATLGEVARVIRSLDNRLLGHVEDPAALLLPERRAMEQLYLQLLRTIAEQGQAGVQPQVRELSRVAFLYLNLSSSQLAEADAMNESVKADKVDMVLQSDQVLRWAVGQIGTAGVLPPPINNAVRIEDWQAIVAQLDFWRRELTGPPFLFDRADLQLPQPAGGSSDDQ